MHMLFNFYEPLIIIIIYSGMILSVSTQSLFYLYLNKCYFLVPLFYPQSHLFSSLHPVTGWILQETDSETEFNGQDVS